MDQLMLKAKRITEQDRHGTGGSPHGRKPILASFKQVTNRKSEFSTSYAIIFRKHNGKLEGNAACSWLDGSKTSKIPGSIFFKNKYAQKNNLRCRADHGWADVEGQANHGARSPWNWGLSSRQEANPGFIQAGHKSQKWVFHVIMRPFSEKITANWRKMQPAVD